MAIASFASLLIVAFGMAEETATQVSAIIMAGASVVGYIIGEGLADAAHTGETTETTNPDSEMYDNYALQLTLNRCSPYYLYCEAATTLLNPNVRTPGITTQASYSGAVASYLSFDQSVLLIWPHLSCMVALTIAAFTVSYIAFMRQEIRA